MGAFKKDIAEGQVRIVLNISQLDVSINNNANDFIETSKDSPVLKVEIEKFQIDALEKGYALSFDSEKELLSLESNIWFDVDIDNVSNILNNPISFVIEGNEPTYITYYISNLEYKLEWLQYDKSKEEISTVSVTKRTYSQPILQLERDYSLPEIAKAAELLSKAIHKIDLRTGSAYVRLKTNDGELDPVISLMAENMGYQIEALDKKTREEFLKEGRRATHLISLQMNF